MHNEIFRMIIISLRKEVKMQQGKISRGWHEVNGIKFYGSHLLPDMLHDALSDKEKFRRTSYCQICMRDEGRCVCKSEGYEDVKERMSAIKSISTLIPCVSPIGSPTYLGGNYKEHKSV